MADRYDIDREKDWDRERERERAGGPATPARDWDRNREWERGREAGFGRRDDWTRGEGRGSEGRWAGGEGRHGEGRRAEEGRWTGEGRYGEGRFEDYGQRRRAERAEEGWGRTWGSERPADFGDRGDWGRQGSWGTFGNRPDYYREGEWRGVSRRPESEWGAGQGYTTGMPWSGGTGAYYGGAGAYGGGIGAYGERGRFAGRGPKGWQRSDDRIRDDVNERLTDHPHIDATEIEVNVKNGEVTLSGTVDERQAKRLAEDIAESVSGVRDVHNNIRVQQRQMAGQSSGFQGEQSRTAGSTTTRNK